MIIRSPAAIARTVRTTVVDLGFAPLAGTVGSQMAILLCGVATGLMAARMLGPTGRGELAAAIVWPTAVVMVVSCGLMQAVTFRMAKHPDQKDGIWGSVWSLGAAQSALLLILGAGVIHATAGRVGAVAHESAWIFLGGSVFYLMGGYPAALFQGSGDIRAFNWVRVMTVLLYAAILAVMFFAHRGYSVRAIVLAQVAGFVVISAVGMVWAKIALGLRARFDRKEMRQTVRYGLRAQGANLTGFLNQRVDQLVLSLLVPSKELGFYAVAVTLTGGLVFLPTALGNLVFAKASQQQARSAAQTIRRSLLLNVIVFSAVCGVFFALIPPLCVWLFGRAFAPSIPAARILMPGVFMLGMAQVLYNGANAIEKPEVPSYAEAVSLVLTAVGLAVLVPRWGYIGAALVSSVAYSVSLLVCLALLWKHLFAPEEQG